eukprot:m.344511 g.344511  ORF g.344511 m.344511 type:complete len:820 (+) comp24559_c0_seq1:140-2599(+)
MSAIHNHNFSFPIIISDFALDVLKKDKDKLQPLQVASLKNASVFESKCFPRENVQPSSLWGGAKLVDSNCVAVISNEALLTHAGDGVVSGSWVKLESKTHNIGCYIVQIFAEMDNDHSQDEILQTTPYVLKQLAVRMALPQLLSFAASENQALQVSITRAWAPQNASILRVARVRSPGYQGKFDWAASLAARFQSCPKVVNIGDVIELQEDGETVSCRIMECVPSTKTKFGQSQAFLIDKETSIYEKPPQASRIVPEVIPVSNIACAQEEVSDSSQANAPSDKGFHENNLMRKISEILGARLQHVSDVDCDSSEESTSQCIPHSLLILGSRGSGKTNCVRKLCKKYGLHLLIVSAYELMGDSLARRTSRMEEAFKQAIDYKPCILVIRHIHVLTSKDSDVKDATDDHLGLTLSQLISSNSARKICLVIGTTHNELTSLASQLLSCFVHIIQAEPPSATERALIINNAISSIIHNKDINSVDIAQRTAGFSIRELHMVIRHARLVATQRNGKNECLNLSDIEVGLAYVRRRQEDLLGAPKIPQVTWDDIGGLAHAKKEILDTVELPLKFPELIEAGLRRSGVLLYGPPGTGKTLLAKAVATECSLNFFSVKGPELINPYVGQSEANIRAVFAKARAASPCVVFFDELDSLAPNRGVAGDSGGVMDRIVSQLLAELDGLRSKSDVFIIGATNRPDLIDPGLLRPGRLDRLVYLGTPSRKDQRRIFGALTRKFNLHPQFDLERILTECSPNFTGADLYALCSDAMLNAIRRHIAAPPTASSDVVVNTEDFLTALGNLTPSVTDKELAHYTELHKKFGHKESS